MTLKEKFKEEELYINPYNFKLTKESAENFEKIADDYAIEFAEWVDNIRVDRKILYDTSSIKQLLEIFKKEKGL